ncbi:MAG: 30S ribosomal protein S12 methylthiotransferase RimO [Bacilli bacterium]|nr:30S ribosomal protein S12 methylthiotransferase RimO [Acholeplasmataceae bacterium]MDY2902681.1 30S ribosomal protein S12 methylthiotransferase RimO [Bacilli bacterium]
MKDLKIGLISLGCEKNLVDSEMILGLFKKANVEIVTDLSKANAIIINTCGFIESAKKEAIDTIFEALDYQENGAKIIVTGCLVQRYLEDLKKAIPEVDLYIPIRDYNHFGDLIMNLFNDNTFQNQCLSFDNRVLSTPPHLAYLKISEGCNNCCAYCAIPLIRGGFVSRPQEEIITEFKYLVSTGRKEICLISQDLTKYGIDLKDMSLAKLLKELVKIDGDYVIRLLYLYPDEITDELIDVVKNNDKILNYFDIPVQHASDKVLKWMGRRGNEELINNLLDKIRKEIPDVVLRTTVMVGFPHESEKDFEILKQFIERNKFDHLGAFTYSREENTKAYKMNMQVPQKVKEKRLDEVMEVQKWISYNQNKKYLNKVYDCIVESFDSENNQYYGRGYMHAPDDIDGEIIIKTFKDLIISKKYKVKIIDTDFFDIYGEIID